MLPQSIKKNDEFKNVYKKGKKIVNKFFIFYYFKNNLGYDRIGFTVSKKVGNAVVRNKVKRRLKAFLRENTQLYPTNFKLVIIARSKSGNSEWQSIKEDLTRAFKIF